MDCDVAPIETEVRALIRKSNIKSVYSHHAFNQTVIQPARGDDDSDLSDTFMCDVCCSEYPEGQMVSIQACTEDHQFCKGCMGHHLKAKIEDGQVLDIQCMEHQCDKQFTENEIKKYSNDEIFLKYIKFKISLKVELDKDLQWCPQKNCVYYVKRQKFCCCFNYSTAKCECGKVMCFQCGANNHKGKCSSTDQDTEDLFKEYIKSSDTRICPHCKHGTQKSEGCNRMKCAKC